MHRRTFIKTTAVVGGSFTLAGSAAWAQATSPKESLWFDRCMRWAQLAFVETDPGNYDPDFWLDYFKRLHADGVLLSAGGIVAFYPTKVPLHYQSAWLKDKDVLGYLVNGCRKMNMSVILRTDPHAARQNVVDAHPDWIHTNINGDKRKHWANPELWVTCALGPYNFDFMKQVNQEIMTRYQPDAIFSNRWSGHGICYCEHCKRNFKAFSGYDLPRSTSVNNSTAMASGDKNDPAYRKYVAWRTERLRELWFLWDSEIQKQKATARFIPNGFPDKLVTGQNSDFFFADQQARSGVIPPWSNGKHAKELRATMGMKPQVGIFSVGVEEQYRWKDSVQDNAEIKIWVAEGTANGLLPCFVKFGGQIYDKRWLTTVEKLYQSYYKNEKYLRNTAPLARVGVVYSEQTAKNYGDKAWQKNYPDHANGVYHALIEDRMPFEMVNDRLLDAEHLKPYKLLILPNIAVLSQAQCDQLRQFVNAGGSLVATFETSLYDEEGKQRPDFGLADLLGVSYNQEVEGPLQNSYLRLKSDASTNTFHPVLKGLEDAYRIINTTHRVKVKPNGTFPSPVTLVPSYPDLPMEDVFPRKPDTDTRELYLREVGKGRIAYIPGDLDRAFWQIMSSDHGKLLRNTIRWALNEAPLVDVTGPGIIDVTAWQQKNSMTVHIVNLTNPMLLKGPFRELIPVDAQVSIRVPKNKKVTGVHLLLSEQKPAFTIKDGLINLKVSQLADHEIIALDVA
ncbi:beta-galactosidase trimerization domain-containing protein [Adhaeribacter radiodurans]|uniref:Beta-galactosidase trimerization domain-containing protein n=1 Tax=Adhaeribacter radiodurans TaxID=2745197 RepID=A0A7L7LCA2_9BACT|nr:beta-galactosidase trimerization domain-containing protein [Adhaeribacter radiodurans]QMU30403.1 beta-galactosidase trimerization domain-containing protein [Adhaeribacter radiodurans]